MNKYNTALGNWNSSFSRLGKMDVNYSYKKRSFSGVEVNRKDGGVLFERMEYKKNKNYPEMQEIRNKKNPHGMRVDFKKYMW